VLFSCESESTEEKTEELGKQAAIEFCDCYKDKNKETCLEELTSKYYKSDYMNDEFISVFNRQSSCGITLEKIQLPSKSEYRRLRVVE